MARSPVKTQAPATNKIQWALSERQRYAWWLIAQRSVDQLLYGGAKGGGKSVFLCRWAWSRAMEIIRSHGLTEPLEHPIPVGWMGRLKSKHFKDTTLQTWFRFIDPSLYRINKSEQTLIIGERVKIDYGGLDAQGAIDKFNSAEYGFICLDQAEEVPQDKVDVLLASRRLVINDKAVAPKALFTANPRPGWLKDEFLIARPPHKKFVQALPTDNPWLPAGYLDILRDAFKYRPELLAAYLDGDWSSFEGHDQVILEKWLNQARKFESKGPVRRRFLVCDPARYGDDETIMYQFADTRIVKDKVMAKQPTDRVANELHRWAVADKLDAVAVDEIGVGAGVVDQLRQMANGAYVVIAVNAAAASQMPEKYLNVRAEMWMAASQLLEAGDMAMGCEAMSEDDFQKLKSELTCVRYEFRGQKIKIASKDEIKAELRRSPDRADTAVMGWWVCNMVPAKPTKTVGGSKKRRGGSAMAA